MTVKVLCAMDVEGWMAGFGNRSVTLHGVWGTESAGWLAGFRNR